MFRPSTPPSSLALLDTGATIEDKNNMMAFSAGRSDYEPAKNPNAPGYSIGGSSSGTAAAVAAGEVDIGFGGDQGGSIRMPASLGGIVGLKPTHGLIPYTGIFGVDASLDYTGPMTRTVEEAASALDAVAGRDGLDPRQPHDLEVGEYTGALDEDVPEMTVGVLQEGFDHEEGNDAVTDVARDAIANLETAGAEVTGVSVPEHFAAGDLNSVIARYGYGQVLRQNGVPSGLDGWYDTGAVEYLGRALEAHSSDLPPSVKNTLFVSEYSRRNYDGSVYGKAQNRTLELRRRYDEVLGISTRLSCRPSPSNRPRSVTFGPARRCLTATPGPPSSRIRGCST
jgi:amidase